MNRKELIRVRLDLIKQEFFRTEQPLLVAVTKRLPFTDILYAYEAGQRDFGENRIEELLEKAEQAIKLGLDDIRWHFIGKLQSNKVKKLFTLKNLYAIHSIDSLCLLDKILERSDELKSSKVFYFLQVNTSGEKEKSGLKNYDELASVVNRVSKSKDTKLLWHGLMTMSKIRTNDFEDEAKKCFKKLALFRKKITADFEVPTLYLSMGMSGDYKWAIEAGSDYVRLGSSIFSDYERG
jgi:PLP dependent protein